MSFFLNDTLTHMDIYLGDLCNLRCLACPSWLEVKPLKLPQNILWPRIAEAISYVEKNCPNFDKLMFIGGEPFFHPGLANFLQKQSFSVYLIIYTNFTIPLLCDGWPNNVHFITSLDAPDSETYFNIRRAKAFPILLHNIKSHSNWLIHIDTTVSKSNIEKLDEILSITEEIGCTHWFLPIDPRMLRYANEKRERFKKDIILQNTVSGLRKILLSIDDLSHIKAFFKKHELNTRINDFKMFKGLYLSGIRHYQDLPEYTRGIKVKEVFYENVGQCSVIHKYLEITFTQRGNFVPIIHCPELRSKFPKQKAFSFRTFEEMLQWISDIRLTIECNTFCGRTQFLGIDEYKDIFSEIY